ncbi:phage baseplate assembly protein V [Aliivibrio salmonicida]|uniref:phage baseplate assembly protein V n=1 Tax=Aliivibrio salmonicida TaxID=40269 RepID=UPI00406D11EC
MIAIIKKLQKQMNDVVSRFQRIISVAYVAEVDSELHRVKVRFPSEGIPNSDWLPIVAGRSKGVKTSFNLQEGEQVLCLFIPWGDMNNGFVLGALNNAKDKPYTNNPNKFGIKFTDGTLLEYDQETQTGVLKIKGATPSIQVGPDKTIIVSDVLIDGAVTVTKTLDVTKAVNFADTLTVLGAVNGMQTASFMGLVGAAGYGGPVSGAPASMNSGMEVSMVATINGIKVSVDTHIHKDAENRPTSPAIG